MLHLTYTTDEELDAIMRARGLYFYREHFPWGKTPAYRNKANTTYRFVDRGDLLTPTELLTRLLDDWRPVAREEWRYAACNLSHDLKDLEALETQP